MAGELLRQRHIRGGGVVSEVSCVDIARPPPKLQTGLRQSDTGIHMPLQGINAIPGAIEARWGVSRAPHPGTDTISAPQGRCVLP